jgi:hypothetical protein
MWVGEVSDDGASHGLAGQGTILTMVAYCLAKFVLSK